MLRLRTLGGLSLRTDDGVDHALMSKPKRLALLVYLAAANGAGYRRRDQLMSMFWPELDGDHARSALRQAMYVLRRDLGDGVVRNRGEEEIGVDAGALWFDVTAFSTAVAKGHVPDADLYHGDFLEAFFVAGAAAEFDQWVESERQRLRTLGSRAMWLVADDATRRDPAAAIAAIRRAVALAPDDEIALRRALGQLAVLGDRAGALQLYQSFRERLQSEYSAEPSTETKAIGQALQLSGDPELSGRLADVTSTRVERIVDNNVDASPSVSRGLATSSLGEAAVVAAAADLVRRRMRRVPIAATILAAALVAVVAWGARWNDMRSLTSSGQVAATDELLVADVSAPAPDSLAARAITELLRSSLVGTPAIRVVTREAQDQTLRRMLLPVNTRLTDTVALEVALRNGYEAVLLTDLMPLGGGFVLTARLTTVQGAELVTTTQRATSADALIAAVDRLSRDLRARIGESQASLVDVLPLQQVTTRSLKALSLFTQAQEESRLHGQQPPQVLALLRETLEADSTFAMAHRRLGAAYYNLGLMRESLAAFRAAERFSERLSHVDRLSVLMMLHGNLRDFERAIGEAREVLRLDPRAPMARNMLPMFRFTLAQYGRVEAERKELGMPVSANALLYQGQSAAALEEARRRLRAAHDSTWVNSQSSARNRMAMLHALRLDYDSAEFYARPGSAQDSGTPAILVASRIARGQLSSALTLQLARARSLDWELYNADSRAAIESFSALATMIAAEDRAMAGRRLDLVLADSTYRALDPANRPIRPVLALALAGQTLAARREFLLIEQAADSDVVRARALDFEFARGAIALSGNRNGEAITAFDHASKTMMFGSYDACRVCALPWLGRAYDQSNQPDSVVAVYERYLTTGDPFRVPSDALWRARILQRLGRLHAQRGDTAMAMRRLAEFIAIWKDADGALQPAVADARRQLVMLRSADSKQGQGY